MAILDDLMQEVKRAYSAGKARTGTLYDEHQFQIQTEIQQWDLGFLAHELTISDLFSGVLKTTIETIRQGELAKAEYLIYTMKGLIENGGLSPDSQCACRSFLEAGTAYFDYKCHRYDQAIGRLQKALAIDEQVEQRNPRFAHLHLHRIMLLDNWIRVLARRRQYHEAIDLAFQVLDYLERKIPSLPVPTSWDSSQLTVYPAGGLSILFRTITSEIAEVVIGTDLIDSTGETMNIQDVFAYSCHHTSSDNLGSCHLSRASHDWIHMKQAALDKNFPAFLQYAARILAAGPVPWPTLWYATIVEVITFSRHRSDCDSDALRAEVAQDAVSWSRFPPTWKAMIDGAL